MHRFVLTALLLLLAAPAWAVDVDTQDIGISFHIAHPAKEFDGKLLAGGGKATLTMDPSDLSKTGVDVAIQVGFFNSENKRRDSHMIEVLEGLIFPSIDWKVQGVSGATGPVTVGEHKVVAKGPLTLHGVTKDIEVPVKLTVGADGAVVADAEFSVSLEAYEIDRPTLVFVPIEDIVPIKVRVAWPANAAILQPPPPEPTPAPEPEPAPEAPTE